MVDIKQAAQAAEAFARSLYDERGLPKLRIEEVDLSEDGRAWEITLGWDDPAPGAPGLVTLGFSTPRVYKTFRVDSASGEVKSMKIRSVR